MTNQNPCNKTHHAASVTIHVTWMILRSLLIIGAIVLFSLLTSINADAETVTRKEATAKAQAFMNEAHGKVMPGVKMVYDGRRLTTQRLFVPFYVFNLPAEGFVIVSAENKTFPILAYSLTDRFDPDRITDAQRSLLRAYARDIEMIRYDTSDTSEAIAAWTDYPTYAHSQLHATPLLHRQVISHPQADEMISNTIDAGEAPYQMSDIFTPAQWQSMVDTQLRDAGNAVVGIVEGNTVTPMVVYERKGDFYRISLPGTPEGESDWMARLMASEVMSGLQIGCFNTPIRIPETYAQELPFGLIDTIMSEAQRDIAATYRGLRDDSDITLTGQPRVENLGGGHYTVFSPEQIDLVRVYNISGNEMMRRTYRHSDRSDLDLSIMPAGIYILSLTTESGKTHGMKITR